MLNYYALLNQNFLNLIPYVLEFNALNFYSTLAGHPLRDQKKHKRLKKQMIAYIEDHLKEDAQLMSSLGIRHRFVRPKDILAHYKTLLKIFVNYRDVIKLRNANDLSTKSEREYPKYFNRNFHFQTDGYTSVESASIYEHQVELLFAGMAAPMRRLLLNEVSAFKNGKLIELACGTGAATKIVSEFLPEAQIKATDISHEYLEFAKENIAASNIEFSVLDATELDQKADCVYHVFLLHELPSKERKKVLEKQLKALKPGGRAVIVDSIQVGDVPFLDEVLYDFPLYFHEPFYKHYIEHPIEDELRELGATKIKTTIRLFSKCVSFSA